MDIFSLYFSPTGGTKKVTELIAREFGHHESVDLTKEGQYQKYEFAKEDICIIGAPAYGGRIPDIMLSRLRQMKADGAQAIVVIAYGNRAIDDAMLELRNELTMIGFHVVAGLEAVTEHSIVRTYGAGRPDERDIIELKTYGNLLWDAMKNGERLEAVNVPGNEPYREYNGVPAKPKSGKGCTHCGTCVNLCPVGAITKDDKHINTDNNRCISCMRCVKECPVGARMVNKLVMAAMNKKLKKLCAGHKENVLYWKETLDLHTQK